MSQVPGTGVYDCRRAPLVACWRADRQGIDGRYSDLPGFTQQRRRTLVRIQECGTFRNRDARVSGTQSTCNRTVHAGSVKW